MKILRVGDPHVKVNNIKESEKLLKFIVWLAVEHKVDRIEILGDLFHTHSIIRLEVLRFWEEALIELANVCEVVVLVGNHDQTGDYSSSASALDVFQWIEDSKKNLKIVNIPTINGQFLYVPYIHDSARFVDVVNSLSGLAKVLVCHQTFKGSKYESGMYTPDGIDVSLLSPQFIHVISGHIHSRQEFGRVKYPGTPRWDTTADANQPKGLTIYVHSDSTGEIISEEYISTEGVCSPILQFSVGEGEE